MTHDPSDPREFAALMLEQAAEYVRKARAELFRGERAVSLDVVDVVTWERAAAGVRRAATVPGDVLDKIDQTLRIPAAEYVPAIGDVFQIIDDARR